MQTMQTPWKRNPVVYEINTAVWLTTLSQIHNQPITLANVPDEVVAELASYRMDAIWLMGVWERGPATRASALNYIHEYRPVLPDIEESDIIGSAFAIHNYVVDPGLGGREGMAVFRHQLHQHGIKLITDFVPNHVATDHPWIAERPDYFIIGTDKLLETDPGNFFATKNAAGSDIVIAHGRDPYFPGWIDSAQLNAFSPGYREAAIHTLKDIADQCDGVRCDMAMLMMTDVFKGTWGWRGIAPLNEEFWPYIIPHVKRKYPHFLFVAETYWGMDYVLHTQGFDYTYDKTMYDRLLSRDVDGMYAHLGADVRFLARNMRFIENHDELRAMETLGMEYSRPAITLLSTLPGALLLHDGQFTGRRVKLPVQIARQPYEREYPALRAFYRNLLEEVTHPIYRDGEWTLFQRLPACMGCQGHQNIIAYGWYMGDEYRLVVLNMSGQWSQARIDMSPWLSHLSEQDWKAEDMLGQTYTHQLGDRMIEGLQVNLDPYACHIYRLTPLSRGEQKRLRTQMRQ